MMTIQRLIKKVAAVAVSGALLTACGAIADPLADKAKQGKALFDERCKTTAGEKIYRTVEDVEGIVLLKVRPGATGAQLADKDWPGAAFARESSGDYYITNFLAYEHSVSLKGEPVSSKKRGYISTDYQPSNPSNLPGYRYVDVVDEKTGERWRYSGSEKIVGKKDVTAPNVQVDLKRDPNYDLNIYRYTLDRRPAPADGPRYGVTYEDHVIPEERALGVASSTVKVIDLKTREILGEMTMYAWTPAVLYSGPRGSNPTPWLSAYGCVGDGISSQARTRKFVDQVLKPSTEK